MRVTKRVHALKVPFQLTVPSGGAIDRFVYVYLVFGETICLIDSGVAGSERRIFDYVRTQGRSPVEISHLLLTHSHPDHIGAARAVRDRTGCAVCAHPSEKAWIEDIDLQARERPVAGFHALVGSSVPVDRVLEDGDSFTLDGTLRFDTFHTPGHSRGSLSFRVSPEGALFTGDAVPLPGGLPIYEDSRELARSIRRLMTLDGVTCLLGSWDEPQQGDRIQGRFRESLSQLRSTHEAVQKALQLTSDPMEMCRTVLGELGLPKAVASPLVLASFLSHRKEMEAGDSLFEP